MSASLGSLVIQLAANTAQLQSDLGKAQRQVERFASNVNSGLKLLGAGISIAGVTAFVKSVIDAGDRLNDLRTRTGLTGQQLIVLEGAAVRSGASVQDVSDTVSKLSRRLAEAQKGTGDAAAAYQVMGIKLTGTGGALKSVDEILRAVGEKFRGYEDGANKAVLATAALGKGGDRLIPMVEALDETEKRFKRLGITISEDLITASDRFNDKMEDLKSLSQATGREIATPLLPSLEELVNLMIELRSNADLTATAVNAVVLPVKTLAAGFIDLGSSIAAAGEFMVGFSAMQAKLIKFQFADAIKEFETGLARADRRLQAAASLVRALFPGDERTAAPAATGERPRIRAPRLPDLAASKAAADEFQKYLQARTKNELEEFKDALAHKQAMLDLAYQDNRLSDENYFRGKLELAKDSAEEEIKAVDALREAQYAALGKTKFDTKDYWEALQKVEETEAKRAKVIREFGQLATTSFEQAKQAAEKYRRSIEDVTTQLLEITGNTGEAARRRFDAQFRDLKNKAGAEGDTAGMSAIDRLRELTGAQADFNRLREDEGAIGSRLQIQEERIQNSLRTGAISEFEALQRTGAARMAAAGQLDAIVGGLERVSAASQNPALVLQAEQARAALEKLRSEADLLGEKFESIFSGAAADAFTDFINGSKSASEAFKSFANSVVNAINRMVAEALAKQLWKVITGGGGSGISGILSSLFGGGSGTGPLSNLTPSVGDFPLGAYATGTDYVPRTGVYQLHQGEAVVPAAENRGGGRSIQVTNHFIVQGAIDRRSQDQVAVAAGRGVRRAMARDT